MTSGHVVINDHLANRADLTNSSCDGGGPFADGSNLTELYAQSQYLAGMRQKVAQCTRGCIVMDNPQRLVQILQGYELHETTTRGTAMKEYTNTSNIPSHDMEPELIPEKSRPYRWLKRNYFFGFGAYG